MTTTYFGVDCAKWQGTIDWAKVKAAGVKFAILKATRKDNTAEDVFAENYSGCVENGISVGVYRYVYAKTAQEAENEAHGVLAVIKGRNISCGVWLDLEDNTLISLGKTKLLSIINAERKILEEAGYPVGIYCNQAWYNGTLPVDSIDLPFWLARYGTNNGTQQVRPEVKCSHTLWGWQYSSVGRVSGIPGGSGCQCGLSDTGKCVRRYKYPSAQRRSGGEGQAAAAAPDPLRLEADHGRYLG